VLVGREGEQKQLASELTELLERFRTTCEAIVIRRNRRIAHSDLATLRTTDSDGLKGPSRAEIEAALSALRAVMQRVYQYFMNSYMAYEHFAMTDDANGVLRAVAEALRYRELQKSGQIPDIDLVQSATYRTVSQ
jgi:hypothetical protein